jgi:hypothetical protein
VETKVIILTDLFMAFLISFRPLTRYQYIYATTASLHIVSSLVFITHGIIVIREVFETSLINTKYRNIECNLLCTFHK